MEFLASLDKQLPASPINTSTAASAYKFHTDAEAPVLHLWVAVHLECQFIEPMWTQGEHANSTEKMESLNPGLFCSEAQYNFYDTISQNLSCKFF